MFPKPYKTTPIKEEHDNGFPTTESGNGDKNLAECVLFPKPIKTTPTEANASVVPPTSGDGVRDIKKLEEWVISRLFKSSNANAKNDEELDGPMKNKNLNGMSNVLAVSGTPDVVVFDPLTRRDALSPRDSSSASGSSDRSYMISGNSTEVEGPGSVGAVDSKGEGDNEEVGSNKKSNHSTSSVSFSSISEGSSDGKASQDTLGLKRGPAVVRRGIPSINSKCASLLCISL